MLREVTEGVEYHSPSGLRFKALHKAKHAQDCSYPQVVFTNLEPTHDRPANDIWALAESIFMKTFSLPEDWVYMGHLKHKGIES